MKVLIFGGKGYFGGQFRTLYPEALCPEADIADPSAVDRALDREKPDIVINCAGKTGRPNVDWCEDHKMETLLSNVTGPLVLLEACMKRHLYLVQMSTGCIYEGDNGGKGFSEEDPPNFFGSFYSKSKAWIDQIMQRFPVLQLRLRMPFDGVPHERNLITKLTRYSRVLDAENSLTYLPDFLNAAKILIGKRRTGTYNVVNPGTLSPFRVMELYREIVDPLHTFTKLTLAELPTAVRAGRSNCILSTEKLEKEGIRMRPLEEAMQQALQGYALKHRERGVPRLGALQ